MPPLRRILPAIFAACILSVTRSSASVSPPPQAITVSPEAAAIGICTIEPAPPANASYAPGTPEAWTNLVWRIHPDACAACAAPQALAMESIAFRLRWLGKCTAQVELTIIGATGPNGCPQPDTTNILCGPTLHPIESDFFPGLKAHTLPIIGGCCISQDAFVRVRFVSFTCDDVNTPSPALGATNAACTNCETYIGSSVLHPGLTDWCSSFSSPPLALWTRYTANCCDPVPTIPRSWGQVKAIYR